jgi:uncharacterized protein YkwD
MTGALALALALSAASAEDPIARSIRRAFEDQRARVPERDPVLDRAARALATVALDRGPREATDAEAVASQTSLAGGWDPPPRALVVRASPPSRVADALAARADLAAVPATHFGVGLQSDGARAAAVILLAERRAWLDPFARAVAPGSAAELCGRLTFPLHDAHVVLTGPSGVLRPPMRDSDRRDRFCAEVRFARAGAYTLEVVANSAKGPEVAALFRIQVGKPGAPPTPVPGPTPETDPGKAQAQVLAAINARRGASGLPALARSALLDKVASDHAREMAALGYFAHVSPVHGDVAERLRRAGFGYRRVAENLGEAESALSAERVVESSPGHLANVLDREVTLVGIGTAAVERGALRNVLLTVVFAQPR